MSIFDLEVARAWLLVIPPAAIVAVLLLRKIWRVNVLFVLALKDFVGTAERPSMRQEMESLRSLVVGINKELHPNGGSSMRDQIVRVEANIAEVKQMASEAKERAADAASEAEDLSGAVARFHHDAQQRATTAELERRGVQESLDVLLRELQSFADKGYVKERAYIAALRNAGIDLTHITDELEDEGR